MYICICIIDIELWLDGVSLNGYYKPTHISLDLFLLIESEPDSKLVTPKLMEVSCRFFSEADAPLSRNSASPLL